MAAVSPLAAMGRLLAEERAALLSADLTRLPGLIAAKERLLRALEGALPPDAAAVARLRAQAEANQGLIAAALRGLRAAGARIETARAGGPALATYDDKGRAARHGTPRPSITRRA